mmetsp:Transcript_113422/g.315820  ORF Transcript_113422/g.315820 Transcript_113422/m.315820 type:complete len:396 (+) Transcript_113422:503-1690(+)
MAQLALHPTNVLVQLLLKAGCPLGRAGPPQLALLLECSSELRQLTLNPPSLGVQLILQPLCPFTGRGCAGVLDPRAELVQLGLHPFHVILQVILEPHFPLPGARALGILLRLYRSVEAAQFTLDPIHMYVELLLIASYSVVEALHILLFLGPRLELANLALDPVHVCIQPFLEVAHPLMKAVHPGIETCLDGCAEAPQLILPVGHTTIVLLHKSSQLLFESFQVFLRIDRARVLLLDGRTEPPQHVLDVNLVAVLLLLNARPNLAAATALLQELLLLLEFGIHDGNKVVFKHLDLRVALLLQVGQVAFHICLQLLDHALCLLRDQPVKACNRTRTSAELTPVCADLYLQVLQLLLQVCNSASMRVPVLNDQVPLILAGNLLSPAGGQRPLAPELL